MKTAIITLAFTLGWSAISTLAQEGGTPQREEPRDEPRMERETRQFDRERPLREERERRMDREEARPREDVRRRDSAREDEDQVRPRQRRFYAERFQEFDGPPVRERGRRSRPNFCPECGRPFGPRAFGGPVDRPGFGPRFYGEERHAPPLPRDGFGPMRRHAPRAYSEEGMRRPGFRPPFEERERESAAPRGELRERRRGWDDSESPRGGFGRRGLERDFERRAPAERPAPEPEER